MDLLVYWLVFLVVFLGILIISLAVHSSRLSSIRNCQNNINIKADDLLKSANFNITKKFYLNDYATYNDLIKYKKFIAVDNNDKKVSFIDYEKGNMIIVKFDELLNYEIYENGSKATTGASIGGFWSGIFGAETNGMCKELKLIIRLKRYDISQVSYEIISNTSFNMGINKSSQVYKKCISTLQEVVSFLEVVKNENDSLKEKDTNR